MSPERKEVGKKKEPREKAPEEKPPGLPRLLPVASLLVLFACRDAKVVLGQRLCLQRRPSPSRAPSDL